MLNKDLNQHIGSFIMAKLLDIMRDKIRVKHYSIKTENVYIYWAKKYILFHNKRHPKEMGKKEIEQFLTHLAKQNLSPTSQNQAFYGIIFLYEQVLNISLKNQNIQALRAKERKHIPVVLTIDEVKSIILNMKGIYQLIVKLMYGCGLRIKEVQNIRVKDIDFLKESASTRDLIKSIFGTASLSKIEAYLFH